MSDSKMTASAVRAYIRKGSVRVYCYVNLDPENAGIWMLLPTPKTEVLRRLRQLHRSVLVEARVDDDGDLILGG